MKWYKNQNLFVKFGIVIGISVILLGVSLVLCLMILRDVAGGFRKYTEKEQAVASALKDMYAQGLQSEQATRNIILNPQDKKALKNYEQAVAEFAVSYERATRIASDIPDITKLLEQIDVIWQEAHRMRLEIQESARSGDTEEATNKLVNQETPKWREVKELVLSAGKTSEQRMEAMKANSLNNARKAEILALSFGAASIALSVGLLFVAVASLRKSLRIMNNMMDDIASGNGDLTKRLSVSSSDEIGALGASFNLFLDKLHATMSRVAGNAVDLKKAAGQLLLTSEQMATAAGEVAAQTGTIATASEEMSATASDIAENCFAVADNSAKTTDVARHGATVVGHTVSFMAKIAERVETAASRIEELGGRSDEIGEIIRVIEDIADQTNLLALNAAIEAARAGDQGRGFAVVADEVRALAERTTKATKEIGQMIKAMQLGTRDAVSAMKETVTETRQGTAEASRSGEALGEILLKIEVVTTQINQIATAAEEQTATMAEISGNIEQISTVINETASGAHKTSDQANELDRLAVDLKEQVGMFRL